MRRFLLLLAAVYVMSSSHVVWAADKKPHGAPHARKAVHTSKGVTTEKTKKTTKAHKTKSSESKPVSGSSAK